jgi:hypothetical protein
MQISTGPNIVDQASGILTEVTSLNDRIDKFVHAAKLELERIQKATKNLVFGFEKKIKP